MNILYICNDLSYFMAHRGFLANAMKEAGHNITVLAGHYEGIDVAKQLPGIEFLPIHVEKHRFALFSDLALVRTVMKLNRDNEFNVVHTITMKPNLYGGLGVALSRMFNRRRRPRVVMTFPGLGRVFEPSYSPLNYLRKAIVSQTLRIMNKFLVPSATFENYQTRREMVLNRIVDRDRAFMVMGAGIEPSIYYPVERNGVPVVLFAGRLLTAKGVEVYIEAASKLKSEFPSARFLLAGAIDESDPDHVDQRVVFRASVNGIIEYLDFVLPDDIPELLRTTDVLCAPTRLLEGLPRVILEAAASGCAIIASDQKSVAPIVIDGETGWLLKTPDLNTLVGALREALSDIDRTRSLGEEAAIRMRKLPVFEEDVIFKFTRIYKVGKRRRPKGFETPRGRGLPS